MKKVFIALLLSFSLNSFAQIQAVAWSGGTTSWLGLGYLRYGDHLGIGVDLSMNIGTLETYPQSDTYEMTNSEILDQGKYSWRYEGTQEYDRGLLTFRLYLCLSNDGYFSHWAYLGAGPGWSRHFYKYEYSGGDETQWVMHREKSISGTEWQLGYMFRLEGMVVLAGYSALKFSEKPQATFGFGFEI